MPDFSHWKTYGPIGRIVAFDTDGAGPLFSILEVTANTHDSANYPETRVCIAMSQVGSVALTLEQSARLRADLERAEDDVRAGMAVERADG